MTGERMVAKKAKKKGIPLILRNDTRQFIVTLSVNMDILESLLKRRSTGMKIEFIKPVDILNDKHDFNEDIDPSYEMM